MFCVISTCNAIIPQKTVRMKDFEFHGPHTCGGRFFVTDALKQVSLVSLALPVDLTDFWKTESMGVSVSTCTCEASKLSAQKREAMNIIEESAKLQSNKWIMKYPCKRDPPVCRRTIHKYTKNWKQSNVTL